MTTSISEFLPLISSRLLSTSAQHIFLFAPAAFSLFLFSLFVQIQQTLTVVTGTRLVIIPQNQNEYTNVIRFYLGIELPSLWTSATFNWSLIKFLHSAVFAVWLFIKRQCVSVTGIQLITRVRFLCETYYQDEDFTRKWVRFFVTFCCRV